jgi:NlpC/P60 family putative phage cell wall peptidase
MLNRQQIVMEARSWLGTRFKHQGRIKASIYGNGACDCLGLVMGIARNLELKSKKGQLLTSYDLTNYEKIPNGNILLDNFSEHFISISMEQVNIGDILIFQFNNQPQHIGITSIFEERRTIIHAFIQARHVVEHTLDQYWQEKICMVFRFAELNEE